MRVNEIMIRDVSEIEPSASLTEAAARMKEKNVRNLLVTKDERLLGVIMDSDILWTVANGDLPADRLVWEVMSPCPPVTSPSLDIRELIGLMSRHRVCWLPVVEKKRLLGIVSVADVVASLELV
ncbi:MAG: CBS domain-containing protein [Actinobacteria bacterium]|nr:CBS domain-containing protein [Actinomycetota bacterium]